MRTQWLMSGVAVFTFAAFLTACAPDQSPSAVSGGDASPSPTAQGELTPVQAEGVPATWELSNPSDVTADSMTLEVNTTRLECAGGVTGDLLEPVITYEAAQVVIRIDAAPRTPSGGNCQGNDAVPMKVTLAEPLGHRALIDGGCLTDAAKDTAPCMTSTRASAPSS